MKKWITTVITCLLLVLCGGEMVQAFGIEASANELSSAVNESQEEYVKKSSHIDEQGGLVETTEIRTWASDKVLWDEHYTNEYSVKKNIYVRNYKSQGTAGRVNVYIKNTGNKTIKVNIYQSEWNSRTIASGSIQPGKGRTFTVGPEYGSKDCHGNTCFAYQHFTVSLYPDNGKISFHGRAKVYY